MIKGRYLFAYAVLAAAVLCSVAAQADFDDKNLAYTGLKGGYNFADPFVSMIYEEHPPVSVSHVAAYGGYDFGVFRVGGTLWNYFMSAPDDIWRVSGDDPIDQTYIEMGTNGIIGPSADIAFDIKLSDVVYFTPGLGLGLAFRYGDIKQYDFHSKPGVAVADEADLTQDQIEAEEEDNGKDFSRTFPLFHLDLDWAFVLNENWFATLNLGVQTFGPSVGAGVGYHW